MNPSRFLLSAALAAAALAFGACTCPFAGGKCPLRGATAAPVKAQAGDQFSGHWVGTWQSQVSHHHGTLTCDFTKTDAKHYRAKFHATWGLVGGNFDVIFDTHRNGRELRFHGRKDLGKLYGGLFEYDGKVTPERFFSTYKSADDHGTFTMHR